MSTTLERPPERALVEIPDGRAPIVLRNLLLSCGIAASLLYLVANVVGDIVWDGYSSTSYTISELSAIDAPSRPLVPVLMFAFGLLSLAFAFGVLAEAGRRRGVRATGWLLILVGVLNLAGPFVPMHLRGEEPGITDTLHIIVTAATSLVLMLAIWFGRDALGRGFRNYSLATLAVMLVFGILAALDGPRIASGDPTPWVGVTERICVGAYLLWMFMLSGALLCTPVPDPNRDGATKTRD